MFTVQRYTTPFSTPRGISGGAGSFSETTGVNDWRVANPLVYGQPTGGWTTHWWMDNPLVDGQPTGV